MLAVFDAVARLNGSDFQFKIVRIAFWPILDVAFDNRVSMETRKNCVLSLNEHVDECNLSVLEVVFFFIVNTVVNFIDFGCIGK